MALALTVLVILVIDQQQRKVRGGSCCGNVERGAGFLLLGHSLAAGKEYNEPGTGECFYSTQGRQGMFCSPGRGWNA